MGWEADRLLFRVLYTMKFWNCSKTLIDDLADYSGTWTGFDAKYFEDCSESNDEEIILYEKEYREAVDDEIFRGTVSATSAKYCIGGIGTSAAERQDPANIMSKMAFKTFFGWMQQMYPGAFN